MLAKWNINLLSIHRLSVSVFDTYHFVKDAIVRWSKRNKDKNIMKIGVFFFRFLVF